MLISIFTLFRALSCSIWLKLCSRGFSHRYPHKTDLEKNSPEVFLSSPQGKDALIVLGFFFTELVHLIGSGLIPFHTVGSQHRVTTFFISHFSGKRE